MKLIPERKPVRSKAAARAAAEAVLRRLELHGPRIDPESVANELGVTVIPAPPTSSKLSGAFLVKDGRPIILYDRSQPEVRRRFTIAHELAHFLLHSRRGEDAVLFRDDTSSKGTSLKEIQANAFAAALLMPEASIRKLVSNPIHGSEGDEIDVLAGKFNVSSQAMAYRLMDLGLFTPLY